MAERNGFIVHEESFRSFERLSDERLGRLFRAMYHYASGEPAQAFPEDEVLDIIFENIRDRMDRDAVRYEETCKARSEAGKKGGRPQKANGFSEKAKKANGFFEKQTKAKKAKCECECEPDPVPECECECGCEPDPVRKAPDPTHNTPHSAEDLTVEWVLAFAAQCGYSWTSGEAEKFIAFNRDRGRTDGWDFAVEKWEEQRVLRGKREARGNRGSGCGRKPAMSAREQAEMDDYLSCVNRFKEDET